MSGSSEISEEIIMPTINNCKTSLQDPMIPERWAKDLWESALIHGLYESTLKARYACVQKKNSSTWLTGSTHWTYCVAFISGESQNLVLLISTSQFSCLLFHTIIFIDTVTIARLYVQFVTVFLSLYRVAQKKCNIHALRYACTSPLCTLHACFSSHCPFVCFYLPSDVA